MKTLQWNLCFLVLMMLISGCALTSTTPSKSSINESLPTINAFNTISEMTAIAFEWQRAENGDVAGYYLYRAENGGELVKVATIKDRFSTHFVDTGLKPDTSYDYAMSTFDAKGVSSVVGARYTLHTNAIIDGVEFVQVLSNLPSRAKILWTPHSDARVTSYIIERNDVSTNKWEKVAEVKDRLSAEYIDENLKPSHIYSYRVSAKTIDGVISEPSAVQSATIKDLPRIILNLRASTNQPKKITLSWDPSPENDIKHYVIYSSRTSFLPVSKLATTEETTYEDFIDDNGATRHYKVTAVNYDNEEGLKQEIAVQGNTLIAPFTPSIVIARYVNSGIELAWNHDARSNEFKLLKSSKFGKEELGVQGNTYFDTNVQVDVEYTYKVIAIDEYGLQSDESKKVVVTAR